MQSLSVEIDLSGHAEPLFQVENEARLKRAYSGPIKGNEKTDERLLPKMQPFLIDLSLESEELKQSEPEIIMMDNEASSSKDGSESFSSHKSDAIYYDAID